MDSRERRNVNRVFRVLAREWHCPEWMVYTTIQRAIDESWEYAMSDPKAKALWDQYFPNGKPTADQYILFQGRYFENGEDMPDLLSNDTSRLG